MTDEEPKPRPKHKDHPIFTIWVHVGYTILVISMISWMVYMEFFMD